MCVYSMVIDHFAPKFPSDWPPSPTTVPITPVDLQPVTVQPGDLTPFNTAAAIAELRKLIQEFREAVEAAKKVDTLTGQPDCVDPAKASLHERVERLEKALVSQGLY